MSPVSAQLCAAGAAARECSLVSVVQLPLPPEKTSAVWSWLSAIRWPSGAAASAPAWLARPDSGGNVTQLWPPSAVLVMGEKLRSRLGRTPAVSVAALAPPPALPAAPPPPGPLWPASRMAPLVAMSGGVSSTQRLLPAGSRNSCQNSFGPATAPIGTVAQVALATGAADMADSATAAGALGAAAAGRDTLLPQAASPVPAASTAPAASTPARARRRAGAEVLAAERHGLALRCLVMGCALLITSCARSGSPRRPVRSRRTTPWLPCRARGRSPVPPAVRRGRR